MLGEDESRAVAGHQRAAYEQFWWGKRLARVRVSLERADLAEVAELLADA